jgi:hypothetical protein
MEDEVDGREEQVERDQAHGPEVILPGQHPFCAGGKVVPENGADAEDQQGPDGQ